MKLGYFYKLMKRGIPWVVGGVLALIPAQAGSVSSRATLIIQGGLSNTHRAKAADNAMIEKWKKKLFFKSSYKVRLRAVMLLGRTGRPDVVNVLRTVVDSDSHSAVRAGAVMALGGMGLPQAVPTVLNSAAMDVDGFVREQARRTLARFNRPTAIPFVLATSDSEDLRVRKEVLVYLGKAWSSKADAVLIRALGDFPEVFRLAKKILSEFPEKRQIDLLRKATQNSKASVRVGAIGVLADSNTREATDLILEVYQRGPDDDAIRDVLQRALRKKREQLPVDSITQTATRATEKMEARARALTLLGTIGGVKAEKTLLGALREESILLKGTAVIALGKIGNPAHLPILKGMAENFENQRIHVHLRTAIRQLLSKLPKTGNPSTSENRPAADAP